MRKQLKKILLGVLIIIGLLLTSAVVTIILIKPKARQSAALVTLKETVMTVWDYEKEYHKYPAEFGEFRRCSFVASSYREYPPLAGFYYLGLASNGKSPLPIVMQTGQPHWFYQKLLRWPQRYWVQFADGHSELITISPDATGLLAILDAVLAAHPELLPYQSILKERVAQIERTKP